MLSVSVLPPCHIDTAIKLTAGACTGVTAQSLVFPMNTVPHLQVNGLAVENVLWQDRLHPKDIC